MSISSSPPPMQKHHQQAFALQKYHLLHAQHDALQKHIDALNPSPPPPPTPAVQPQRSRRASLSSSDDDLALTATNSASSASSALPSSSPSSLHRSMRKHSVHIPHHHRHRRGGSLPANAFSAVHAQSGLLPRERHRDLEDDDVEEEEEKLHGVNLQIKTTLTELLNCDSIRRDHQSRVWVQDRLMEAEREIKGMRVHWLSEDAVPEEEPPTETH